MDPVVVVKENWFTRPTQGWALYSTFFLGLVMAALGYFYLDNTFGLTSWMFASGETVFYNHQYWRLWTTLFSHADVAHLLSNIILFLPLSFLLSGYFGWWVFPVLGLSFGGLINFIVLKTMPLTVILIGMSGVVYWMGAAWLTLYILVERRYRLRRRLALAFFLTVVLFIPETYKPEISYLSHLVGYILGIVSGVVIYIIRRREFNLVEVKEYIYESSVQEGLLPDSSTNESQDDVRHPKSGI